MSPPCLVCNAATQPVQNWNWRCSACGTWCSDLQPAGAEVDTQTRTVGLEALRRQNFRDILDDLARVRPIEGARVLDVGCAHGWFLDEASARGARSVGVEPDAHVAEHARASGHEVHVGFFPEAIDGEFDIVAFNDVLEHIVDARGTLAAAHDLLAAGGLLSLNIPTSDGIGYRVARLLARIGVQGPFDRFWQRGLPSPHVHYFPREALRRLVTATGFEVVAIHPVRAIARRGLWERVHTVRRPTPASVASFVVLWLAAPVLNRPSASDTVLVVARRGPVTDTGS